MNSDVNYSWEKKNKIQKPKKEIKSLALEFIPTPAQLTKICEEQRKNSRPGHQQALFPLTKYFCDKNVASKTCSQQLSSRSYLSSCISSQKTDLHGKRTKFPPKIVDFARFMTDSKAPKKSFRRKFSIFEKHFEVHLFVSDKAVLLVTKLIKRAKEEKISFEITQNWQFSPIVKHEK